MNEQPGNSQKILIRLPSNKHANTNMLSVADSQFITQSPKPIRVPVQIQTFTTSPHRNILVQGKPLIVVRPTTVSTNTMPKLVCEKRMLCSNCGTTSYQSSKYKCCPKSLIKPIQVTSIQPNQTAQPRNRLASCSSPSQIKSQQKQRMNARTFYGDHNGANEFHSFLATKKKTETLRVRKSQQLVPSNHSCKPEFITISDSSDEAEISDSSDKSSFGKEPYKTVHIKEPTKDDTTPTPACNNSPKQKEPTSIKQVRTNGDDSPIPCKKRKESTEKDDTVQPDTTATSPGQAACDKLLSAWKTATLAVLLKSIRIGQFHHKEPVQSRWSGKDISMTMQNYIVQIPWYAISSVELSVGEQQPCIFFTIQNDFLPTLRSQLGMVPGKIPYFDPGGADDQMFIIFYICSQWYSTNGNLIEQKLDFLRRKLQKPQSFVIKLTQTESNNRQCRIADAELLTSLTKAKISKESASQQVISQNHCVKSIVVSSSTTNSQVAKQSTHVLSVAMSPEQRLIHFTRSRRGQPSNLAITPSKNESINILPVFTGQRKQLAIYPPPPAKGGILITNEDQFCLNEGEFLNDVIIDFYLKYITEEIVNPSDRQRSHVFSCFFYKRLTQNPAGKARANEDKTLNPAERRHRRVQKWTRGVDLFEKDFVFIPINEASHWFLAVVCFPGQGGGYFVDAATGKQVPGNLPQLVLQPQMKRGRKSINSISLTPESKPKTQSITVNTSPQTPSATLKPSNTGSDDNILTTPIKALTVDVVRLDANVTSSGLVKIADAYKEEETGPTDPVKDDDTKKPVNGEMETNTQSGEKEYDTNDVSTVNNCAKGSFPVLTDTVSIGAEKTKTDKDCLNKEDSEPTVFPTLKETEITSSAPTTAVAAPIYNFEFPKSEEKIDEIQYREPCILIFDSLRGPSRSKTATAIREYLNLEWKTRKELTCGKRVFDKNTMKMSSPQVPQQDNYSDCGIFLLQYVEKVFQKPISNYSLPIRNLLDWFDPNECKDKRKAINDIIDKLHEKQKDEKT